MPSLQESTFKPPKPHSLQGRLSEVGTNPFYLPEQIQRSELAVINPNAPKSEASHAKLADPHSRLSGDTSRKWLRHSPRHRPVEV